MAVTLSALSELHGIDFHDDYHKLNSSQVQRLIDSAVEHGYRKPKNANGSRARYYFYALQRKLNASRRNPRRRRSPMQHFLIGTPKKGDKRPRNAFGVLKGFGKAYSAYYKKRSKRAKKKNPRSSRYNLSSRDFKKEYRDTVLSAVQGRAKPILLSVRGTKFRAKPNIHGGLNIYKGNSRKQHAHLSSAEFFEWAKENARNPGRRSKRHRYSKRRRSR